METGILLSKLSILSELHPELRAVSEHNGVSRWLSILSELHLFNVDGPFRLGHEILSILSELHRSPVRRFSG